ncbi:MAG: YkgJ family cysteine cluster protein [Verrucomicrobiota bacterium]|nr:YkgJ family cysteine cluster protein [Verrucomicrobiota bacterium]
MSDNPYYECQRCGNCCRWPGDVKVTVPEVSAIASYLGLSDDELIERYTRLRGDRNGLSLIEKPNHECVFLEGNVCLINAVKPKQCQDFPNKWNFPGWRTMCEAIEVDPGGSPTC